MQEKFIFDGDYSVTADGKVFSYKLGGRRELQGGFASRNKRYRVVTIFKHGTQSTRYVHRLVAEAFLPNPDNLPQINHRDGNPQNNDVSNLEWCTAKANINHAYQTGLHGGQSCLMCGVVTYRKNARICVGCKNKIALAVESAITQERRQEARRESVNCAGAPLNPQVAEYITARASGMTYQEIADLHGCTRQNIHAAIKSALKNGEFVK